MFILDVTLESLIGKTPSKIVCPALQRLNSKVSHCSDTYIKALEDNIVWHHMIEKLYEVHVGNRTHEEKQCRVCLIDKAGKDYTKHAEKVCRKIKCCRIPCSPKASIWIRRAQVYYSLIKLHKRKI